MSEVEAKLPRVSVLNVYEIYFSSFRQSRNVSIVNVLMPTLSLTINWNSKFDMMPLFYMDSARQLSKIHSTALPNPN
jgi:hypothetical protein